MIKFGRMDREPYGSLPKTATNHCVFEGPRMPTIHRSPARSRPLSLKRCPTGDDDRIKVTAEVILPTFWVKAEVKRMENQDLKMCWISPLKSCAKKLQITYHIISLRNNRIISLVQVACAHHPHPAASEPCNQFGEATSMFWCHRSK